MALNVSQFQSSDNFNMAEFNDMISQINSGVNSEISALTTALNGKAKIQTGSYVGTGTYGSSNPCTLTFDFMPKLFIINLPYGDSNSYIVVWPMAVRPYNLGFSKARYKDGAYYVYKQTNIMWGDNSISWYVDDNIKSADSQYNTLNQTYTYFVAG